jgi:hypothetical protein
MDGVEAIPGDVDLIRDLVPGDPRAVIAALQVGTVWIACGKGGTGIRWLGHTETRVEQAQIGEVDVVKCINYLVGVTTGRASAERVVDRAGPCCAPVDGREQRAAGIAARNGRHPGRSCDEQSVDAAVARAVVVHDARLTEAG